LHPQRCPIMLPLTLLGLAYARAPPPRMGGLTGLPRIPPKALALTKKFNPGGSYTEPIATLWRDLETLYGIEGTVTGGSRGGSFRDSSRLGRGENTGKFRGLSYAVDERAETVYKAVKKDPNLLNPAVSNRFELARAKAALVEKLGSERAAISVMLQDPSILREGSAVEDFSAGQIQSRGFIKQAAAPALLLSAAAVAVGADEQLGLGLLGLDVLGHAL